MGNACNRVRPIVCTTRVTCTVPIWCTLSSPDPKVYPDVEEPKLKAEMQPALEPVTSPPTPNDRARFITTLDPVEVFQPGDPEAQILAAQVLQPDVAGAGDDNHQALSIGSPEATQDAQEADFMIINQVNVQDEQPPIASEELAGVAPFKHPSVQADAEEAEATPADNTAINHSGFIDPAAHDSKSEDSAGDTDSDSDSEETSESSSSKSHDIEDEAESQGSKSHYEEGNEDTLSEASSAELEAFNFEPGAFVALRRFELRDDVEILARRVSGRAATTILQSICLRALDTGAATQNCQLLLSQIRIVLHVLARAQQNSLHKAVTPLVVQLLPILMSAEVVITSWTHKGTVEKFMSGRAADDEFLEVHLQLRDLAQSVPFLELLGSLPAHEAAELEDEQASSPYPLIGLGNGSPFGMGALSSTGYCSIEASRAAFERLLLLFILRYKPTKARTQKQRLMDLLAAYNSGAFGVHTAEEQIEHLARTKLAHAAMHAVPLMVVLMTNMWGAPADQVPKGRVDKWRMVVRMALEPLRASAGRYTLPLVPTESVREWVEEETA